MTLGPNHRGDHAEATWRYSGSGYNRVRVCSCGAEDHDPESGSLPSYTRMATEIARGICLRTIWVKDGPDCASGEECGGTIENGRCTLCGRPFTATEELQ